MKKIVPAAFVTSALLIGAATTASPMKGVMNDAFGEPADALTASDIVADADASFAKADLNSSGTLDVDEFAARAVVVAELSRFNGTVSIEGDANKQIVLPDGVSESVSLTERSSIDAVARRTFHQFATEGQMSVDQFTEYRLNAMSKVDRNKDEKLTRFELQRFALNVAQPAQPRG